MDYFRNIFIFNKKYNIKTVIFLIILSTIFSTIMGALLKYVQKDLDVYTTGFFRYFFGLIIILPHFHYSKTLNYKFENLKLHLVRSIFAVPAMYFGFSAIANLQLEKYIAISFVVPVLVSIMAIIINGEKLYLYRIFSLILGIIGMLIIIRPGIIQINLGTNLAIVSCILWSIVILITKKLSSIDSVSNIILFQYISMSIVTLVVFLFNWNIPSVKLLLFLFLVAITGTLYHILINQLYKIAELTIIAPFSYLGLIWGSLLGYLYFHEIPDLYTWLGGSIIFISVLFISFGSTKLDILNLKSF